MKSITIYTDGACIGNPGPGGYGVVLMYGSHRKELSGGFTLTTNNRMELLAYIIGLEALKEKCNVTLFSDSKYVIDAMVLGWAKRWRLWGWRKKPQSPKMRLNHDLWARMLEVTDTQEVRFNG